MENCTVGILSKRIVEVISTLAALEKEHEILIKESTLLKPIAEFYNSSDYEYVNKASKLLTERMEQLKRRVYSLSTEIALLTEEKLHLEPLVKLYKNTTYDAVEDERNIIEAMKTEELKELISKKEEPNIGPATPVKRKSKYYEYFDTIWAGATKNQPLNIGTIHKSVVALGVDITESNMWNIVKAAVDAGHMRRVSAGTKVNYIWLGKDNVNKNLNQAC